MKKAILLVLVLALSLALLAGCSQDATQGEAEETVELSGEITFSTWGSLEEKKVNEEIIAAFEAENPGTKVNLEYIPEEYTTKIDSMFLGGVAPDVIYGHPKYLVSWASQGLLMDLDEYFAATPEFMDEDVYNVGLYDAFMYDGHHIGTINGADTILMYYNKDLFDAAGIETPSEDWTWDDFLAAAEALTIFDDEGKPIQYGCSVNAGYTLAELFIYANGGEVFDDPNNPTEVLINSEESIEALQFMQDLIHEYNVAPTAEYREILGGSFDTGKIAMVFDGVWSVVYRTELDFEYGLAELPGSDGPAELIPALYAGYGINKDTENPDLAWAFAKYMQSATGQEMLASSGLITVINKDIATSDAVIDIEGAPINHILRVTSLEKSIHNDAMVPNWDEYLTKGFNPALEQLINNTITAEECAALIEQEFNALLNEE